MTTLQFAELLAKALWPFLLLGAFAMALILKDLLGKIISHKRRGHYKAQRYS
jgi:hypothetical protein